MALLLTNFAKSFLLAPIDADDTIISIDPEHVSNFPNPGPGQSFMLILWEGAETVPEIVECTDRPLTGLFTVIRAREGTTARAFLSGTKVTHGITAGTFTSILATGVIAGNMATEEQAEAGVAIDVLMSPNSTTQFWNARTTTFTQDWLTSENISEARSKIGFEVAEYFGTGLQDTFELPAADWDNDFTRVYVDEVFVPDTDYDIVGVNLIFDTPPPPTSDPGFPNIAVVKGISFAFSTGFPPDNSVGNSTIVDNAVTQPKMADNSVGANEIIAGAVGGTELAASAVGDSHINASASGAIWKKLQVRGATTPTAGTLNLDAIDGDFFQLSGTTTVVNATLADGDTIWALALSAFLLSEAGNISLNNAGSNINVNASDWIRFSGIGGGVVEAIVFRANGTSIGKAGVPPTFAEITSKPTTLAGYGITNASLSTHTHTFAQITSKPTTRAGYNITDASPFNAITNAVGSYAFLADQDTPITATDATQAGSMLRLANADGFTATALSGTWRLKGAVVTVGGGPGRSSVWERIA